MSIKIESKAVKPYPGTVPAAPSLKPTFADFCRALAELKIGESFVYPRRSAAEQLAISAFQHAFGHVYRSRAEGKSNFRFGRIN